MTSTPDPSTATVIPPAASAPRCAAESTPRARPLTTTTPRTARSPASCSATDKAYGDAAREPTTATASAFNGATQPRVQITAGGSAIVVSAAGYAGSLHVTAVSPRAFARSIAAAASLRSVAARDTASDPSADERGVVRRVRIRDGASPARNPSAARRQARDG